MRKSGDCSNAFQCTYEPDISKQIFCYLLPYYLVCWYSRFPTTPLDPSDSPFIVQSSQNIQGTPHATNCWKKNVDSQLSKIGCIRNNVDKAFYTHHQNRKLSAMVSTTVDNFYLSSIDKQVEDEFSIVCLQILISRLPKTQMKWIFLVYDFDIQKRVLVLIRHSTFTRTFYLYISSWDMLQR